MTEYRSMYNDVVLWMEFVNKNIDIILNIRVPEHPPNNQDIRKWIDKHEDLIDKQIAYCIANNIQNVSYKDLLGIFNDIVNELVVLQEFVKRKICLVLPVHTTKSNFIFTVLFSWLCEKKNIFFTSILPDIAEPTPDDETLFILVDDASYSGNQIGVVVKRISRGNQSKVFLAIPYISTTAEQFIKNKIQSQHQLIVPSSCKRFKNIQECIDEQKADIVIESKLITDILKLHLLYLDFKLPDSISIPQTIFAYGYKLRDSGGKTYKDPDEVLCFISDCKELYREHLYIRKDVLDINRIIDVQCPNPFYKRIKWNR
jgi:hypothetical protein